MLRMQGPEDQGKQIESYVPVCWLLALLQFDIDVSGVRIIVR